MKHEKPSWASQKSILLPKRCSSDLKSFSRSLDKFLLTARLILVTKYHMYFVFWIIVQKVIENSKRNSTKIFDVGVGYYNLRRFGGKKSFKHGIDFYYCFSINLLICSRRSRWLRKYLVLKKFQKEAWLLIFVVFQSFILVANILYFNSNNECIFNLMNWVWNQTQYKK